MPESARGPAAPPIKAQRLRRAFERVQTSLGRLARRFVYLLMTLIRTVARAVGVALKAAGAKALWDRLKEHIDVRDLLVRAWRLVRTFIM